MQVVKQLDSWPGRQHILAVYVEMHLKSTDEIYFFRELTGGHIFRTLDQGQGTYSKFFFSRSLVESVRPITHI